MAVVVRVPTALRRFSDGQPAVPVEVEGASPTVGAVLTELARTCPGVVDRVLDEQGRLRRHVNVFVGADDVRVLGGLTAPVGDGTELTILPAVSGGAADPDADPRLEAAAALRDLGHAFVAHDADDATLEHLTRVARELLATLEAAPRRVRLIPKFGELGPEVLPPAAGSRHVMDDRGVAGTANPMAVRFTSRRDGKDAVAEVWFGSAFEGAPGRVHGGLVAAVFDDLTGYALAMVGEPGFTGSLTVVYRAPVPIETMIEFRARLRGRSGRKLFVEAEARLGELTLATAEGTMIVVDPSHFATHANDLLRDRGTPSSPATRA